MEEERRRRRDRILTEDEKATELKRLQKEKPEAEKRMSQSEEKRRKECYALGYKHGETWAYNQEDHAELVWFLDDAAIESGVLEEYKDDFAEEFGELSGPLFNWEAYGNGFHQAVRDVLKKVLAE